MKTTVSLRAQINIRIIVTGLIILVLGGQIAVWQARQTVKKELDSSLNLASQLIQINFLDRTLQDGINVDDWLPRFVSLEQTRHLSIQLQQPDGKIINFAAADKANDDMLPPHWFVNLLSAQVPKIEQHINNSAGDSVNLIIQANPIDEISEAWQESRAFFMTLVIMTAITFLAVNLLFNKTLAAIGVIVEALKAIEQGNYQHKLAAFSIQEYDSIAKAINHMSGVLAATSKENQALTRHTLEIQEEERQHLAKELHDELGQSLTAIRVMATTIKNDKANTEQIADTISSVCEHLITVVRSMMRNLHPLALTELGLKAGLEDLLNHWSQRHPELSLTLNCPDNVDKLEQKITIQVFRIVQECLTNIIRHAQAANAEISLDITPDQILCVEVRDNGEGCSLNETKKGFGLLGIRERILSLGGELSIKTAHQQGLALFAKIPLT